MNKAETLIHLEQLNIELLDTLEICLLAAQYFCKKNNIPFKDDKVLALIKKTEMLLDEIAPPTFLRIPKLTDDFLQRKKSDKDFTEPRKQKNKSLS